MSLFDVFKLSVKKEEPSDWLPDFVAGDELATQSYLKIMAKNTVIDFVSRTMSTLEIRFKNTGMGDWDYILNVRPNSGMSATTFWQTFFSRLLDENEVSVILKDDQLLIVDNYTREQKTITDDCFSNVYVKEKVFAEKFYMLDVIYLKYSSKEFDSFTKGLFNDYSGLSGRILEISMRNNQIRGSVSIEAIGAMNEEKGKDGKIRSERLQEYVNKIYHALSTKAVAIIPKVKGFDYEKYTNKQGSSNQSLEELNKMKPSLIDDAANTIGVPTALTYGEKSELDSNIEAFRKLCIIPLMKKLQDELTAKILTRQEYKNSKRIKVTKVLPVSTLENATQIGKIVPSGTFLRGEVREETGYDALSDGEGKKLIMTKNYVHVKGGEEENDKD